MQSNMPAYYVHRVNDLPVMSECRVMSKGVINWDNKCLIYRASDNKRMLVKKWNLIDKLNYDRERITPNFKEY